ncbi:hypothetical protein G6F23_014051 [Rhizopus arrhizus]|nr:hypothetical protein G6F23_014051 [Rhizopus arrhizus]
MDASSEITVARQHGHRVDGASRHGVLDRGGQGAGVADAGGATVAHDVQTDRGQIVQQSGAGQVIGRGGRAGAERRLDPGRHAQARLARLAGQEPGRHQQAGIRRRRRHSPPA